MGKQQREGWVQKRCKACSGVFATPAGSDDWPLCMECTQGFEVYTEDDLKELLEMFHMSDAERKALKEQVKGNGKTVPVQAKAPVDPVKVAQGIRTQCAYAVMPADGGPLPALDKPITYICAKNGLFEIRHSDVATIVSRPKEVLGITQELKEGVQLNLPKIPFLFLQQTIAFFRGVEKRRNTSSEAIVQIWWDREKSEHFMHIPEQTVGGASVHHNSTFDQENSGRYIHFADIHSHTSSMAAFWSGTDNADERRVCGERVFGVIGKINQPIPDWKWRLGTRGGFIDMNITDVVDMPTEAFTFRVDAKTLYGCINDPNDYKDGQVRLWCPVTPFTADVVVPEEWYAQVKGHSHSGHGWQGHWGGNRGHQATQQRFPSFVRGLLYIDGVEYEVNEHQTTPTGKKLIKKGESLPPEVK